MHACPVASDLVNGWSSDVDALGQGAIIRHEDPSPDVLDGGEELRGVVSPGSKEFRADRRLGGGAIAEALR
jgi:hypothetical protein